MSPVIPALAVDDGAGSGSWNPQGLRQLVHADARVVDPQPESDPMTGAKFLVVVDDFDIVWSFSFNPAEANAPLVVHANAVLSLAIAFQCL